MPARRVARIRAACTLASRPPRSYIGRAIASYRIVSYRIVYRPIVFLIISSCRLSRSSSIVIVTSLTSGVSPSRRQRYRTFQFYLFYPRSTNENSLSLLFPKLFPGRGTKTASTQLRFACHVFSFSTRQAKRSEAPEACSRFAATRATSCQGATPLPQSRSFRDIHSDPGNSSISFIPSVTTALSRAFVSTEQPPATPLYLLLRARPFGSAIPPPPRSTPPLSLASAAYRRSPASSPPLAHPHVHSRHLNNKYSLPGSIRHNTASRPTTATPDHFLPRVSLAPSHRSVSLSFSLGLLL